ncbi:MAG: succinylglutamate desuccinylase/aspartoacylase family protein, partial [Planktotalea arctica]
MSKRAPFEIVGECIAAGTRKTVRIPVSTLSDHTPVAIAAHVIHGKREGPCMFVSAGIHGDEVIGVEIVRRLLRSDPLVNLRGTLIVVPIVNTFGFLNHSRYLPDRRDLNRCFPGSPHGSLASRLAHIFLSEIVARCTIGIDLHSAAVHGWHIVSDTSWAGYREMPLNIMAGYSVIGREAIAQMQGAGPSHCFLP